MKVKLISLCIVFICVITAIAAGALSVHRSEGRISLKTQEIIGELFD